ncbi:MAG: uroporphyrinogen-III C-methyltransferase [Arenicellales bacterium]
MTEENVSTSETGAEPGSPAQGSQTPQSQPHRPSYGVVPGIVAVVLSIAAAALTGYLWYQVEVEQRLSRNQELTDMKSSVNTSKVELTALEKKFDALREQQKELGDRVQSQVDSRIDALQSAQKALGERSDALSKSIEKIYQDLDRNLDSWALEEVEQLMRIGNNSLRLGGDVTTATTALQLADQRLEELGNPAFLEVRKLLAKDITALKGVPTVDIAGLTLRLGSMAGKVENLPLAQKVERPVAGKAGAGGKGESGGKSNAWVKAGKALVGDLERLVRIQNVEKPPKPLLTPDQRYFLFTNLRLMLSGAQLAALRRNTATFHDNLDQAEKWIKEYFDTSQESVQQLLGDIDKMSGVELNPKLPDISDSLEKLKEVKKRMAVQ